MSFGFMNDPSKVKGMMHDLVRKSHFVKVCLQDGVMILKTISKHICQVRQVKPEVPKHSLEMKRR